MPAQHIFPALILCLAAGSASAADSLRASPSSFLYEPLRAEAALPLSPENGQVKSIRLASPGGREPVGAGILFAQGVEASLAGTRKHPVAILSSNVPFYEPRSLVALEISYEKGPSRTLSVMIEPRAPERYFSPHSMRPAFGLLPAAPAPPLAPPSIQAAPPSIQAAPASAAAGPMPATAPASPALGAPASEPSFLARWAPWPGVAGICVFAAIGIRMLRRRRLAHSDLDAASGGPRVDAHPHADKPSKSQGQPLDDSAELDMFERGSISPQSGIQLELALLYAKMGDHDSALAIISDIMQTEEFADARPSAERLLRLLNA